MTSTEKQLYDNENNPITDTNAVHKTGVETIAGQKTLTDTINITNVISNYTAGHTSFIRRDTNYDTTVVPTTNYYSNLLRVVDKNDIIVATIRVMVLTGGKRQLQLQLKNSDNTTTKTIVLAESD